MIGQRTAGAFLVSELGRSGNERRSRADRRQASEATAVERRTTAERRIVPDRRLLTDLPAQSPGSARSPLNEIDEHRHALSARVGRDVGHDVAALDYLLNVRPGTQRPTVIDSAELAEIERRAMTDPLTGLFNRGFFESVLTRELASCRRHDTGTAVLLVDLDDLKATNDRWGHGAGDAALRSVATVIRRQLRGADVPCRVGGDEFAIVLPDTRRSGALLVGERIVADVRDSFELGIAGFRLALTVSVGVSWYSALCDTYDELLEAADTALYDAKAKGGDCVAEVS